MSLSMTSGQKNTRTACVSAEDSSTYCSTTSRGLQQLDEDDVTQDVSQLPDTVVKAGLRSDIIERLTEKKQGQHEEALNHLNEELSHITSVYKDEVRTICLQLLTSLQDRDHRLETLKVSMEGLQHDNTEAGPLWQQVEQEANVTKENIVELKIKLRDCERQQTAQIARVLKKFCDLLVDVGLMPLPDVHRLIHAEAMRVNQSLLANRRSVACLVLRLQEDNLQKEAQLHLLWEEHLYCWRQSQAKEEVKKFRSKFSINQEQHHQLTELTHLSQQRRDIISSISSLVPPTCSTTLVADWFNRLTAINQQIDLMHNEHLHLLRCKCEEAWQDLQAEAELSKVALLALQLPDEEVSDMVRSQLLPLIGRRQSEDEERLAALKVRSDTDVRHASHLSNHVLAVMRGMALLWETHCCQLKRREEVLQRDVDKLRRSKHRHLQEYEKRLEELMEEVRQQSTGDTLRVALDNIAHFLKEVKLSHKQCVPDQWQLIDRLPSLLMDELQIYSSNIGSFFHLRDTYRPSSEDLQKLQLSFSNCLDRESEDFLMKPTKTTLDEPISSQSPAQDSQDWVLEVKQLCDISTEVTFTTSRGVVYSGPAFRSPAHNLPEPHLSLFPEDLLSHTLDRFRLQFLENLEQHFLSVLQSAVTTVTERREAAQSEEQLYLQKLDLQHIKSQVYQPRLDELRLHRRQVARHRQSVANILTSCSKKLTHLQASIGTKNQQLKRAVSELEQDTLSANSIKRLQDIQAALQDIVDQHATDTQRSYNRFRQTVSARLGKERTEISKLLKSFRLFSEGGDCSPEELKQLHMELQEENQRMEDAEENIYSELEAFMSPTLKEVKEASAPLKEKLAGQESELMFTEKIQKMMRSTNILITTKVACSNQQQSEISRLLEDLRRSIEDTQMSPAQTISLLSSLVSKLNTRCQYLDFVAASEPLKPHRKSQSRVSFKKKSARSQASTSAVQPPQKVTTSVCSKRVRAISRSIRANKKYHIFGSSPDSGSSSFRSVLNTLLWSTNDTLLQTGEDFYFELRGHHSVLQLLPGSADQWVESMQQILLGYQERGSQCEISSRAELVKQLSSLDELLQSLPSVLIGNQERKMEAELQEAVGEANQRLEEALTVSEREKAKVLRDLQPFLNADKLQSLNSVELRRQQQAEDAICRIHLELQDCVRGRGEEFVTSLSSLMEQLLTHAGQLTCDVTQVGSHQDAESVAMEMKSNAQHGSSSDTTAFNSKLSLRVQEEQEAAVKRFQQLVHTELSLSERNKRQQLSQQQCWNTHWKQEIHTLSTQLYI
ncbi:coiled-coil domain-containing protein 180 isoform X2 [Gouania willdenowi]|uniref:coiled-coil domain-containing protein 180 isoform X2 n=1 Tax=Gouania willdenowi TaxID=441366 RepID=UPI0010566DAD|nr:coiled-coil domain-containing protein 180 isoform X2 [Gouania willdenowi]XP_028313784.1 coiled-coil domain-containing protein 180 isoform X2 [Gouania willdenowi]